MQFGVALPNYGMVAGPEALTRIAREAEALGYASLWTTDHIIVPESQPEPYGRLFEALTVLAYLAGRTERALLGASVIVMPQRNAVLVAKEAAAIDALSGGRLILGVGAGWSEDEFRWLNAPFHQRGRLLDEQVAVMRALWTQVRPRFEGRFHNFADVLFEPKPVQPGGIPIWVGGNTDAAVRRAARLGDAWHPVGSLPDDFARRAAQVREQAGGRHVALTLRVNADFAAPADTEYRGASGHRQAGLVGGAEQIRDEIEKYRAGGLEHLCLAFPRRSADEFVAQMRRFTETVAPHFA